MSVNVCSNTYVLHSVLHHQVLEDELEFASVFVCSNVNLSVNNIALESPQIAHPFFEASPGYGVSPQYFSHPLPELPERPQSKAHMCLMIRSDDKHGNVLNRPCDRYSSRYRNRDKAYTRSNRSTRQNMYNEWPPTHIVDHAARPEHLVVSVCNLHPRPLHVQKRQSTSIHLSNRSYQSNQSCLGCISFGPAGDYAIASNVYSTSSCYTSSSFTVQIPFVHPGNTSINIRPFAMNVCSVA